MSYLSPQIRNSQQKTLLFHDLTVQEENLHSRYLEIQYIKQTVISTIAIEKVLVIVLRRAARL